MAQDGFSRKHPVAAAVTSACFALSAGSAWASPADTNAFQLLDAGQDNVLSIVSPALEAPAGATAEGNRITVSIEGDANGGWGEAWTTPLFGAGLPAPGLLEQTGWNNAIALEVSGTGNLFSIVQAGTANLATGQVSGIGNALAVVQQGQGNIAHFSQAGSGNALSIAQTSW